MNSMYAFTKTSESNFLSTKHHRLLYVPTVRILLKFKRSQVQIFPWEHTLISYTNEGISKTHPLVPTVE